MEPITTTLAEIAKLWRGPYETEKDITENILEQAGRFADGLSMPDLYPIIVAVCAYARCTKSEEKVNELLKTMKELNNLAIHIANYGELLEILRWLEGRRLAMSRDEVDEEGKEGEES